MLHENKENIDTGIQKFICMCGMNILWFKSQSQQYHNKKL